MSIRIYRKDGRKTETHPAIKKLVNASAAIASLVSQLQGVKTDMTTGRSHWEEEDEAVTENPVTKSNDLPLYSMTGLENIPMWNSELAVTPVRQNQQISTKLEVPLDSVLPKTVSVPLSKQHVMEVDLPQKYVVRPSIGITPTGLRLGLQTRKAIARDTGKQD